MTTRSNETKQPYRMCGCVYFDTEAEAIATQTFLREVLGAGGFTVESYETREDGAVVTRTVSR